MKNCKSGIWLTNLVCVDYDGICADHNLFTVRVLYVLITAVLLPFHPIFANDQLTICKKKDTLNALMLIYIIILNRQTHSFGQFDGIPFGRICQCLLHAIFFPYLFGNLIHLAVGIIWNQERIQSYTTLVIILPGFIGQGQNIA